MDASKFFPSKWLTAEDMDGREVDAIIESLKREEIGNDMKPVLYLTGFRKGLVLNKTNNKKLIELLGTETDNWNGKKVKLYTITVPYKGEEVEGIRIKAVEPEKAQPQEAPQEGGTSTTPLDDIFNKVREENG